MPYRTTPLVNGQIYHVMNRGVNHQIIFSDRRDYKRYQSLLFFYQFLNLPTRYSKFNTLPLGQREKLLSELKTDGKKLISLISYCLMPNHFHIIVKQEAERGVSRYLSNLQNSYTKYFNLKNERIGHLFQGQFKAVRIQNENQLLHTSRYVHLNPYASYLVKNWGDLINYPWSSLNEYIGNDSDRICITKTVLSSFPTKKKYLEFMSDQKDYQRTLAQIKHLALD